MRPPFATRIARLGVLACLLFAAAVAHAQTYPAKPVRLVVPFPPSLYASLPHEPLRNFAPTAHVADSTNLPVVG